MISKFRHFLHNMRFRTQLSIMFIFLSVIPIIFSSIFTYSVAKHEMIRLSQNNLMESIRKTNHIIDSQLAVFVNLSDQLNIDPKLLEVFKDLDAEDDVSIIRANRKINDILRQYISLQKGKYSVHLVTSYFKFGEAEKNFYPPGSFITSAIAEAARKGGGSIVWIPTYDYVETFSIKILTTEQVEYGRLISAVRKMNVSVIQDGGIQRLPRDKEQPILVINFTDDYFLTLLKKYSDSNYSNASFLIIVTPKGEVVCSDLDPDIFLDVDWIGKIAKKDPYGSMMANVGGKEHIIAYSISDVTGWIVAIMLPYNSFGNVVTRRIFLLVISMAAFFILASFVSSYFVSNRFSKKILGTLKAVEQVTDANFDAELQYNEHEEFAFFYERLNWMQNNMMRLIYENYEAELRKKDFEIMVLNIQLNPHFLYNTLNIINWVCIEENAYRSSDIIVKLSRMLQYTSDNSMELTPLRSDIEWIQQYIFIMSIRYEKKFSVSYNIHDSLLDMRVPKLFLQPLVENAIIHGFCNIQTGGILNIAGIPLDDHVLFSVEDNGIGINKEKAEAIMRDENNSIGIKNTDRRIKMLFGMQYGLFIDSKPGSGTVIMIKMPLD